MCTHIYTCIHVPQTVPLLLACPYTLHMKQGENNKKWFKGLKWLQGSACQEMVQ